MGFFGSNPRRAKDWEIGAEDWGCSPQRGAVWQLCYQCLDNKNFEDLKDLSGEHGTIKEINVLQVQPSNAWNNSQTKIVSFIAFTTPKQQLPIEKL